MDNGIVKKDEIINEIHNYMFMLSNCFTYYVLNERLIDWYEANKTRLDDSKLFLSFTSRALQEKWIIQFVSLFLEKEGKNVIRFCNFVQSTSPKLNDWITPNIVNEVSNIKQNISKNDDIIKSAKAWRDKVFAHNDKIIFNKKEQTQFAKTNIANAEKINNLIYDTYSSFNNILNSLGKQKRCFKYVNILDIDNFFYFSKNLTFPQTQLDLDKFI